jgi:hypothetical protein
MTQDTFLNMRIAPEIKEILDELRKLETDLPSRSEMVRRLIVRAVDPHLDNSRFVLALRSKLARQS